MDPWHNPQNLSVTFDLDFVDVIKVRILKWEDYPTSTEWVHIVTLVLIRGHRSQSWRSKQ